MPERRCNDEGPDLSPVRFRELGYRAMDLLAARLAGWWMRRYKKGHLRSARWRKAGEAACRVGVADPMLRSDLEAVGGP
jgi:hypothetical protein